MRVKLGLVSALVTAALAAVPTAAVAAPSSTTFTLSGVETAFSSTSATFSGRGNGNAGD